MCIDQDTWSVNISLNGRHFAKITLPPELSKTDAIVRTETFRERFPRSEGWQVDLSRWVLRGEQVQY